MNPEKAPASDLTHRPAPVLLFRVAACLGAVLLLIQLAASFLIHDAELQLNIANGLLLIGKLFGFAALLYTARYTARVRPALALPWLYWSLAFLGTILGDVVYYLLSMVPLQPSFPSLADLFYVVFYVLIGIGLVKYPVEKIRPGEKRFIYLDNLIVVLCAGLGFWYLLLDPALSAATPVSSAALVALVYPMLDVLLLWGILIFFRNNTRLSAYLPILLIGLGAVFAISADVLYAYQVIHQTAISDTWMQLGWLLSVLTVGLAGMQQVRLLATRREPVQVSQKRGDSIWPVYLPYFWLAVAYAILSDRLALKSDNIWLYLVVGLIISLVISRQVLTLNENRRLFQQAQQELEERKQAQELLHQANLELDEHVRQRTLELHGANLLLLQSNQKLETSLREKEVLIKEIHHRVKNNLQTVSSLLSLQARLLLDPAARSAFKDSQMRVQSMALIHEKLYQSENLALVNLRPYIENLVAILLRSYQAQVGQVRLVTQLEDVSVGIDTAVPVGLILNELISNAFKHAFADGRAGTITIRLWREDAQRICLSCQDDGRGLPPDFDIRTSKSLGMQLVNSLVNQLAGELHISGSSGVLFGIHIPLADVPPAASALPGNPGAAENHT
jgi:two-component sensor histidine kinase